MPVIKPPRTLIVVWIAVLVLLSLALPTILVMWVKDEFIQPPVEIYELPMTEQAGEPLLHIPVYLSQTKQVVNVPLELYVRGVVAAEMPAEFEMEALKAQAIAARTYIVRKIVEQDFADAQAADGQAAGAWVTNSTADQVFLTEEDLQAQWTTREYASKISKINRAVEETRGLIITYHGKPIDATYFSTSNGYTENSEEYWTHEIPYLRSVASPWDANLSPKYKSVVSIPSHEFMEQLGLDDVPASGSQVQMEILEKTSGDRIKAIRINDTTFTGREVREKLGLPSSEFTWRAIGDSIEFTTYGYGHGVGMSQYGANGMALEGKQAEEIITYYYKGVEVTHMDLIDGWQRFVSKTETQAEPQAEGDSEISA